jgi:hypothetical protein
MDDYLRTFRRCSRVFPSVPYARHAPRVGCSVVAGAKPSSHTLSSTSPCGSSSVKILALLCSKSTTEAADEITALPSNLLTPTRKRARAGSPDEDSVQSKQEACSFESAKATVAARKTEDTGVSDGVSNLPADSPLASASAVPTNHVPDRSATRTEESSSSEDSRANAPAPKLHLYVRVQYDRALITTLPIEVMRRQHPQVLIDYLLSMSVWT